MLAPALIAALIGMIVAQDLSYDGTAIWLHITTAFGVAMIGWDEYLVYWSCSDPSW